MPRNWQRNAVMTIGGLLLMLGLVSALTQAAACIIMTVIDVVAILALVAGSLTIPVLAVLWAIDAIRGTDYTERYVDAVRHTVQAIGRQGARVPNLVLHHRPERPTITIVEPPLERIPRVTRRDGTLK